MKKLPLAIAIATTFLSATVMAESWNITQEAIISSDTTLNQTDSDFGQMANLIEANDVDITASQSFALDGHDLTLKQNQAGWQSLNEIYNTKTVIDVEQTVGTGINNIVMDQEAKDSNQHINHINSDNITQALQSVSANSTIRLQQQGEEGNEQVANTAYADDIDNLIQTVMGGSTGITMDQNSTSDGSQQNLNRAESDNVTGTVKQTVSGNLEMNQGGASGGVADGSIQAANRYQGDGNITNIEQNLGSADNTITLTQTSSGFDTAQAGNLIDMTTDTSSAVLTAATQAISTTGTFSLIQTDSYGGVQAGNMLLRNSDGANSGGAVVQTVTVGTLAMQQTDSDNSLQMANYVGELLQGG